MAEDIASLIIEKGLDDRCSITVDLPVVVFGQSPTVEVKLNNPYVSRRHFQLRNQDGVFYITDLDSTNGTYLNGESQYQPPEARDIASQVAANKV